ncbi:hypothetical protein TB2_003095 [Malus domestica]
MAGVVHLAEQGNWLRLSRRHRAEHRLVDAFDCGGAGHAWLLLFFGFVFSLRFLQIVRLQIVITHPLHLWRGSLMIRDCHCLQSDTLCLVNSSSVTLWDSTPPATLSRQLKLAI